MALSPKDKLAAGITRVVDPTRRQDGQPNGVAPYFGAILRGLIRREIDDVMAAQLKAFGMTSTIAVTRDGILYWCPKFIMTLSADELAAALVHEAMHLALQHSKRASALGIVPEVGVDITLDHVSKARLWNMAADACINEEIRKFTALPADAVYPETLNQPGGLPAEERYRRLLEEEKKAQQQQQKSGGGAGDQSPNGKKNQPGKGGGVASGHCGGCAHHPIPGEPQPGKGGGGGGKDAKGGGGMAPGRSEAEMARLRRATAEAVKDFGSRNRGTVPASLDRWATEMLAPPKVPWRQKLARIVRGAIAYRPGAVDFTWSRMSRRQAGVGYGLGRPVVPATHAPQPRVGVLVDTSGSMSADALAAALAEIRGVIDAVGAQVTVAVCDAAMHGIKEVRTVEDAAKLLKGGGGTDMSPGQRAFAERKPIVDVLIILTDGYIGDGYLKTEPPYRTIWCVLGSTEMPCPYGERVFIDEDGVREAA
jgi:predicted metal-dependent peptidase